MKFNWILFFSIIPYLSVMVYDIWMHIHHRKVPQKEQVAHTIAFIFLGLFIFTSIFSLNHIAWMALICAVPILLYDELGFHKALSKHERKIHNIAGICLMGFISVWILTIKQLLN